MLSACMHRRWSGLLPGAKRNRRRRTWFCVNLGPMHMLPDLACDQCMHAPAGGRACCRGSCAPRQRRPRSACAPCARPSGRPPCCCRPWPHANPPSPSSTPASPPRSGDAPLPDIPLKCLFADYRTAHESVFCILCIRFISCTRFHDPVRPLL